MFGFLKKKKSEEELYLEELEQRKRNQGDSGGNSSGFELTVEEGKQFVKHRQEVPPYEETFIVGGMGTYIGKIFVIDDGDHSTMMLAEEY